MVQMGDVNLEFREKKIKEWMNEHEENEEEATKYAWHKVTFIIMITITMIGIKTARIKLWPTFYRLTINVK